MGVTYDVRRKREDGLLTARQAAAYLGIDRKTLRRLVRRGDLPYVKGNGRVRFRVGDLDRLDGPSQLGILFRGVLLGAVVAAALSWARRALVPETGPRSSSPKKVSSTRARPTDRRAELLRELHSLLKSHYATTRFMAALLVLKNRRVADRRQVNVPVAVERRSGRDRRAANIDDEVDSWHRRLAAAARHNRN